MMLRERMVPCQSREAVVTVLSYHSGIMDGYLQHPRLREREKIESLSQLILLLNSLVDLEHCINQPLPMVESADNGGKHPAIFHIQIFFREHYTWQGRLFWENENQEIVFRSVMELIQLLDEILAE